MNFGNWLENNETIQPFSGSTVKHLVFHGTDKRPFKQFTYQQSQRFVLFSAFDVETKGFFFSESPHDALEYGDNIVACYINLKRPLLDPRRDKDLAINRLSRQQEIDLQKILAPMIEKDANGHFIDIGVGRHYLQTRSRSNGQEWIYDAISNEGLAWDVLDHPGVVERMTKLGYDGTFVEESNSYLGRSIFVLAADQVRMSHWVNGPQADWGEKDDYFTRKKDGISNFHGPKFGEY